MRTAYTKTMNMTQTAPTDTEYEIHPWQRMGLGLAPFRVTGFEVKKYQACHGAPIQPGAACDACGTGIMNVYTITSADGKRFVVGCDCVAKTNDRRLIADVKAAQAERRAAAREARAVARREGWAAERRAQADAFMAAHPDFATACAECQHEIVQDIAAKVKKYGSATAHQMALVLRLHAESSGSTYAPAEPPPVNVPADVCAGRVVIVGTILGTKIQESMYGDTLKMLVSVRTPDGAWKAWSTVPAGLDRPEDGWKGMVIRIKARVEVSKNDPTFAFLNRPTVCK